MDKEKGMEKVAGLATNICKQCGKRFEVAYFEGEAKEAAQRSYCLACILGVKREEPEQ